ncbi:peptidase M1, membrane alanine aminopeptidase, partial [mine drainage metagenome]
MDIDARNFLKLNSDESGFYRVLYDDSSYQDILGSMKDLSYLDRWGLVSDMFAFLVSGKLKFDRYVHYISFFNDETDNTVVQEISAQLQQLYLLDHRNRNLLDTAEKFYKAQLARLGSMKQGESVNDIILRGALSTRLAMIDAKFASETAKKFDSLESEIPDMRGAIAL